MVFPTKYTGGGGAFFSPLLYLNDDLHLGSFSIKKLQVFMTLLGD